MDASWGEAQRVRLDPRPAIHVHPHHVQQRAAAQPVAKELRAALDRAIAAADYEEAEVRGKRTVLKLVHTA